MPFQIANVRRPQPLGNATFDLILRESDSEIRVEGCTLVNPANERRVLLKDATINEAAAQAVALKVVVALSSR